MTTGNFTLKLDLPDCPYQLDEAFTPAWAEWIGEQLAAAESRDDRHTGRNIRSLQVVIG
jgi:hypothetical protein